MRKRLPCLRLCAPPHPSAFAVTLLLAMTAGGAGCGREPTPRGRVLLVGIDGASPRLTGPWIEQGLLPHLAEIERTGVSGELRSHRPLLSPRIWTSIATGKAPGKHGITSWVFKEETGKLLSVQELRPQGARPLEHGLGFRP